MSALRHERAVGDTLSQLTTQLTIGDEPYDLNGFTVQFKMTDLSGNIIIAQTATGITISDHDEGLVEYDFPNGIPAGTYRGFFVVLDGLSEVDTLPTRDEGIEIVFFDPTAAIPSAEPTSIDIISAANSPQRVRTVEGTVEERSLKDLIAADQYQQSKNASDAPPWGIRIARTKPPSIVG